jgi:pilus assembly protein Flp/PilA
MKTTKPTLGDLLNELENLKRLAEITPDCPFATYDESGGILALVLPVRFVRELCEAHKRLPRTSPWSRLVRASEGASMVEWALLAAMISLACVAALSSLGTDLAALFGQVEKAVMGAGS